jgi:predicted lipoprotein with Yx(FWY)xxD motif
MKRLISLPARLELIGLLTIFSLIVAACSSSTATQSPSSGIPVTGGATVQIADNAQFGKILATADGETLYTNTVDTPEALKCVNVACTGFWEPYTVNAQPTAGEGLPGSLGTVTRPDGSTQVTYNNQPLYTFYLDKQQGDAKGNGFTDFGGTWQVVALASSPATSSPATSSPGASSGSGGYGNYP